jgi:hypothetical protein
MPKSGARPLDIRISSEVAPDLPSKEVSRQPSDVGGGDKHVIVSLQSAADESITAAQNRDAASLKLSFKRNALVSTLPTETKGLRKNRRTGSIAHRRHCGNQRGVRSHTRL